MYLDDFDGLTQEHLIWISSWNMDRLDLTDTAKIILCVDFYAHQFQSGEPNVGLMYNVVRQDKIEVQLNCRYLLFFLTGKYHSRSKATVRANDIQCSNFEKELVKDVKIIRK